MAQPALEPFKNRTLAIKAEVTEGVDPSGTSAVNSFELLDGKSSSEFDKNERKRDRPFFTGDPFTVSNKRCAIEGMMELTPPTVPGHATNGVASTAPVLKPCGLAQTLSNSTRITRYNPISTGIPTTHAYWWHAGTYRKVAGARGNLTGLALEIGKLFQASVRLQGKYTVVAEATLPTDSDYAAFAVPTVAADDNTEMLVSVIGGSPTALHLRGKMLSVDMGNELKTKQYTEFLQTSISNRKPTFKARFARPAVADFDVYAVRDVSALVEFSFKLEEEDGRYSMMVVRGQIDQITDADIDGDFGYEVTGTCIASDTGGDEFYIEFGDDTLHLNGVLNAGQQGVVYVANSLTPSGVYTAPLAWTISAGALPGGLAINSATGSVTGTPSAAGTFVFTVRAQDSTGTPLVATSPQSVVIAPP